MPLMLKPRALSPETSSPSRVRVFGIFYQCKDGSNTRRSTDMLRLGPVIRRRPADCR